MPEKAKALDKQLMEYLRETSAYLPVTPTADQKKKRRSGNKLNNKK